MRLLSEKKLKISVAESFTGGNIASRIVSVPGASENFIEVKDRSILDQLSTADSDIKGTSYALTNSTDIGDMFLFLAQNTNVEWGLQGIKTSNGNQYIIATSHKNDFVQIDDIRNNLKFNEKQLTFDIHSHPNENGTKGASGVLPSGNYIGDMQRVTYRYYRLQNENVPLPNHYIYHKHSNVLYHYTPWDNSIFIKNMKGKGSFNFLIK